MYTLRQNALFTDEIELQKNDGTSEILKIKIDIRPELVKKYRELQVRFVDLQKRSNSNPGDLKIVEDIGKAVVDVFCFLFGDENAKKIIEFYSDDFQQMAYNLFPYVQNVLVPKFQEVARQRKQAFKRRAWK